MQSPHKNGNLLFKDFQDFLLADPRPTKKAMFIATSTKDYGLESTPFSQSLSSWSTGRNLRFSEKIRPLAKFSAFTYLYVTKWIDR
jgi:hypothetical protein